MANFFPLHSAAKPSLWFQINSAWILDPDHLFSTHKVSHRNTLEKIKKTLYSSNILFSQEEEIDRRTATSPRKPKLPDDAATKILVQKYAHFQKFRLLFFDEKWMPISLASPSCCLFFFLFWKKRTTRGIRDLKNDPQKINEVLS